MVAKKKRRKYVSYCCKTQYFVFYMTIAQQVIEPQANCTAKADKDNKRATFYKNAVCLMAIIFTFMALAYAKGSNTIRDGECICGV